ncbi:nucleobase:cation symporter-2 family protein [Klebsiella aerogenes]|uniref:nucleobase:cation symporter-2 family protein n=1 Tax=Klebsiella aerogenes TaxID=548 RepID=UPI000664DAA1|nr:nucleobase:cation symporter-2 family protein [Klebsiella aerogenes]EKV3452084.1 purine permease [Klebsiella aerogenes]MBK0465270.1 purine permease [Klebsiella aerogenes]HBS5718824.1 purine permease [Klebsiella aerogenes]HBS5869561.1 purine permease [Klebsiella aerogenes]HCD3923482.1 purine permease [Klebsiella aerogenes]
MSDEKNSNLLYGLEQRIPPLPAFFSALQHVLAGLVGIITPPLIIGAALGLGEWLPYLISMSLMASGIGTFLQANRFWGIGAGMICMQGTSFAFLGVAIAGGMWVKAQGGGPQDIMAMLFGVNVVAALVPVVVSRFIEPLKKLFTPIITGSVIALIGISLIKVSIINWSGGEHAKDFASPGNIALGGITLGIIVVLSCTKNRWLRLSSVVIGMAVGCIAAALSGKFHLAPIGDSWFRLPAIFPFGFQFNSAIFLPVALVSLVCILEAVGDLTANCLISKQSIEDGAFRSRLKGGILADGISCLIASAICAFPNTTFAQNNGVIQMTGVASRYVGRYIGVLLILLGLFPPFGEILRQIPTPVLGGATMVMFGCVVAAGIRIITQTPLTRRDMLIVGLAFGFGLGIEAVPAFLAHFPPIIGNLFGSAATSGGLVAIVLNLIIPQEKAAITAAARSNDDNTQPL